jgi:hypothetical protein
MGGVHAPSIGLPLAAILNLNRLSKRERTGMMTHVRGEHAEGRLLAFAARADGGRRGFLFGRPLVDFDGKRLLFRNHSQHLVAPDDEDADALQHVTARVTGMVPSEEALAATRDSQIGAKISPAYLTLPGVNVQLPTGQATLAAIPVSMTVKMGDLVDLNTRYRDRSLACRFIPWTIKSCRRSKALIEVAALQIGA